MEAAVATPTQAPPPEPEPSHDGEAEATRSTEELFQWSGYVNVGKGAEECEHAIDGACQDAKHFHAWVCLPNSFQVRDIADKARAARARKTRALRDPESDSYAVLEAELDDLRRDHYEELVQSLARAAAEKNLSALIESLKGDERFEHHDQDAEEFRRLQALDEQDRDKEEFERLQADMLAYGEAFQSRIDEDIEREANGLRNMPVDEVVELERRSRIEAISTEVYLHAYYTWAMFIGAREPTTEGFPSQRKFDKPEALHNAAPEAVLALRDKINRLERLTIARGDAAGN